MRFWQLQSDLQPFEQPSVYHFCCITVNIFGVPTATKTNNLWSLASPFLWFEDIIQKSFTLTNGTDKGQFQRKQKSFFMFFEVVWEIRKPNLLQILPVIFSFEEIPVSLLLWIFEPCQNLFCYESYSAHFVTLFWILSFMLLFAIHFAI